MLGRPDRKYKDRENGTASVGVKITFHVLLTPQPRLVFRPPCPPILTFLLASTLRTCSASSARPSDYHAK